MKQALKFYGAGDPPGVHVLVGPVLARLPHELLPRPLLPARDMIQSDQIEG